MAKPLTQQQAEEKIKEFNKEYKLDSTYISTKSSVYLLHDCGNRYKISRYKSFFEGKNKCPKCYPPITTKGRTRKNVTEQELIKRMRCVFPDGEYVYISGYTKMAEKTSIVKHKCGYQFKVAPKMMLGVKQTRCPKCANKSRGKHLIIEDYLQHVLNSQPYGNEYEWLEEYKGNNKDKIEIIHKTCNRTYSVRPNDFQQGYRCPHCSSEKMESYHVSFIKKIMKENKIEFETEVSFVELGKYRFDFLIGNLLLEYDGDQHFRKSFKRSDKEFVKVCNRDIKKNNWVAMQDKYSLLRIPPNLKDSDIEIIITEVITGKITRKTIKKYKLYFYSRKEKLTYNQYDYYVCVNKDYFKILKENKEDLWLS